MVGSGVGARLGLLIRSGAALEDAYSLSVVAFDKTGLKATDTQVLPHVSILQAPSMASDA